MDYEIIEGKDKFEKVQQKVQFQSVPSSYQINPQYFSLRLVKIKRHVDRLIKDFVKTQNHLSIKSLKTLQIEDDKRSSYQTVKTAYTNNGKVRQIIPIEKIYGETKDKIQAIYNQIHLLEFIAMKDYNIVDTHTFQLKTFLKDLSNQLKRLNKILPEPVLVQIQMNKKQPFKKSQIIVKKDYQQPIENQPQQIKIQIENLQSAKKVIEEQFQKRKIFNDKQKYYNDGPIEEHPRCKLFTCQII